MKIRFKWYTNSLNERIGDVVLVYGYWNFERCVGKLSQPKSNLTEAVVDYDGILVKLAGSKMGELKNEILNRLLDRDNEMITVKNCLTDTECQIRRGDRGTVCDPSTERFYTF